MHVDDLPWICLNHLSGNSLHVSGQNYKVDFVTAKQTDERGTVVTRIEHRCRDSGGASSIEGRRLLAIRSDQNYLRGSGVAKRREVVDQSLKIAAPA
jgi:hypothetical protein